MLGEEEYTVISTEVQRLVGVSFRQFLLNGEVTIEILEGVGVVS
jgi:hypothetical protein